MRKSRKLSSAILSAALVAAALAATVPAGAANTALKDLMKKMGATTTAGEAKPLAPIFSQTKTMKPNDPDFAGWDAISDKGKAAAEKDDLAGAKATCKDCHDKFRDKYKTKYGSKAP